jgi:hypothetical protein
VNLGVDYLHGSLSHRHIYRDHPPILASGGRCTNNTRAGPPMVRLRWPRLPTSSARNISPLLHRCFFPSLVYNSPRLLAQDGAFTFHSNPWKSLESYADEQVVFADEDLDIAKLYWWHIPAKYKINIIKELSGLGITHRSVYPDLDGVARSLLETEVLWSHRA